MTVSPITIQNKVTQKKAVRVTEDNLQAVVDWIQETVTKGTAYVSSGDNPGVLIPTLEGIMRAVVGDWVVCGLAGEFYPVRNDIFEQSYEVVED